MHSIFLEKRITKEELLADLIELFKEDEFFFLEDSGSDGISIELYENDSLFKSHIALSIQDENKGFSLADEFAEYLSKKYNCDTVRELHTTIALKEFNNEHNIQVFSVLNRKGKKYIIPDDGIEKDGFEIKIEREIKTNYNSK